MEAGPHVDIPHRNRRPVAATIAVVVRGDETILVRRANPPDAGLWGFPGGKIEFGEPVARAAVRELREETHVEARAVDVVTTVDVIEDGIDPATAHHYVLIAVLCRWIAGEPLAADDALEARWFHIADVLAGGAATSFAVDSVLRKAVALAELHGGAGAATAGARPAGVSPVR